nr:MAG TPA: OTU-like cysteine protease [Caudoviricetes sp.]
MIEQSTVYYLFSVPYTPRSSRSVLRLASHIIASSIFVSARLFSRDGNCLLNALSLAYATMSKSSITVVYLYI